tara:strand:- start:348 stop:1214 length:867 start_codon:yes stop_codon:yes gene_type:complete
MMDVFAQEKQRIIEELSETGFSSSHVYYLLGDKGLLMFQENQEFFKSMRADPRISERVERIKSGNPIRDKNKPFEVNQYDFLSRAIHLSDASLIELYLCEEFLDIAHAYLGDDPKIRNVLTWIHPEVRQVKRTHSQNWHRDQEADHNLKIWIYYSDITSRTGALEYVKSSSTGMKNNHISPNIVDGVFPPHGYLGESHVRNIPPGDIISATGQVGTIVFADTNGIHRGGFVQQGERMKTMACYLKKDAYQIKNGPLFGFNYDHEKVNYCDYESEEFQNLTRRQKDCLR